jgi:hypothetical protein
MPAIAQLLIYEFGPDAQFQGQLGGALQRIESGGTLRVREALFVGREADTGELVVVDLAGDGAGSLITTLIDFRLDPGARRRATERALASGPSGLSADTLRALGAGLAPGHAIAALLIEHAWAQTLADAVTRTPGVRLTDRCVEATTLADLSPELSDAVTRAGPGAETP